MKSSTRSSEQFRGWFNLTLFKKNVTRFWPIWGIYTAILAFLLPVELLLELSDYGLRGNRVTSIQNFAAMSMPAIGLLFGAMVAMALFSYLMNSRSVQLLHSLPIRREGLFLTNWLSGLAFFLVPNLVIFLLSALIEAGAGVQDFTGLCLWLTTATVCPMFFFCLALCIAMFTGHILALPVFYGILNALVIGLCLLMDFAGDLLLYNYDGGMLVSSDFARWCTPIYQLYHMLASGSDGITTGNVFGVACYCIVLGAVFTFIALGVYRLRQLERAGDVITVGWLRPVFQMGLGVCVGLLFGLVLYSNFFRSFGVGIYILLVALCAAIGAFAGQMLLKKTLRVFADGWRSCLALSLVMAAALWGVRSDLLGFQRWVPDPAKVQSVEFRGVRTYPDDDGRYLELEFTQPEDIERIVELHKALNADLPTLRANKEHRSGIYYWDSKGQYELASDQYLRIYYTMADGSVVSRWYDPAIVRAEEIEQSGTWASLLNELVNDPAVIEQNYLRYFERGSAADAADMKATGGWISRTVQADGRMESSAGVEITAAEAEEYATDVELMPAGTESSDLELTAGGAQKLWDAFREDLAAGRVERYLLDDKARQENCYVSDIHITLSWTVIDKEGHRGTESMDFTFTPEKSQTSVMAVLEELGLKDNLRQRETN